MDHPHFSYKISLEYVNEGKIYFMTLVLQFSFFFWLISMNTESRKLDFMSLKITEALLDPLPLSKIKRKKDNNTPFDYIKNFTFSWGYLS